MNPRSISCSAELTIGFHLASRSAAFFSSSYNSKKKGAGYPALLPQQVRLFKTEEEAEEGGAPLPGDFGGFEDGGDYFVVVAAARAEAAPAPAPAAPPAAAVLERARGLIGRGQLKKARVLLAASAASGAPPALRLLGEMGFGNGRYDEALGFFRRIVAPAISAMGGAGKAGARGDPQATADDFASAAAVGSTVDFHYTATDINGNAASCSVSVHFADADECTDGTHSCHADALCQNLETGGGSQATGTYDCVCKDGYNGAFSTDVC